MLVSICFHSKWRLSMVDYCRTEHVDIWKMNKFRYFHCLRCASCGLPSFGEARWPTWRRRWIWDLSKVFGQSLGLSKLKWRYCRDIWWRLSPPKRPQKAYVPLIFGSQRIFWGDFVVPVSWFTLKRPMLRPWAYWSSCPLLQQLLGPASCHKGCRTSDR